MRDRNSKLVAEIKGAHSDADMWLGQVHQRDQIIVDKNVHIKSRDQHITDAHVKINELRAQIKQGDEDLRLLMCDIHPDGRARGTVGDGSAGGNGGCGDGVVHIPGHISMMDKIEHVAGQANKFALSGHAVAESKADQLQNTVARLQVREQELLARLAVNPWTRSKVEGLQAKNQEIGSKLGYYKMKTGDLRAAVKVSESIIKVLQRERNEAHVAQDRAEDQRNKWKRKYHATLAVIKPVRIDLADLTVGRNADD
jgi:hypothetical protein